MDEPFSALDVLTADNLRSDLLDLWQDKKTTYKRNILLVTHNIEEKQQFWLTELLSLVVSPGNCAC